MKEISRPSKPKKKGLYEVAGFATFIAGCALLPINVFGGLAAWGGSLALVSKANGIEKKYKSALKEYNESLNSLERYV